MTKTYPTLMPTAVDATNSAPPSRNPPNGIDDSPVLQSIGVSIRSSIEYHAGTTYGRDREAPMRVFPQSDGMS